MKAPIFNRGANCCTPLARCAQRKRLQGGFSLVELLVALTISLLLALAAISALVVTRQGVTTVDAASQLRDNGRFAADLIQRIAVQSGFKDHTFAATPPTAPASTTDIPNITGFNNASSSSSDPLNSWTTRTTGQLGYGSDIVILRYQEAETFPGSGVSDRSMIDCLGNSSTNVPANRNDRVASIFHIAESPAGSGEPALMCSVVQSDGTIVAPQPIIQGVENFQVLYGTDAVTAGAAPAASSTTDSVSDQYLRADQLTVSGNVLGTNDNWRRVRSLRIGMVLRGPLNSAQGTASPRICPFGLGRASSTGTPGSALSSTNDAGTVCTTPTDGRLRQVVTFTVHLRNDQGL